ncbi:hypothetical protein pipiens_015886 [Culex pipiens pipiens]|uniref:Uncharacterized protein n=1 Tax=Culex pipiens pipiens TaxID=38569 RepID=A0ABD1CNL3_CULPP
MQQQHHDDDVVINRKFTTKPPVVAQANGQASATATVTRRQPGAYCDRDQFGGKAEGHQRETDDANIIEITFVCMQLTTCPTTSVPTVPDRPETILTHRSKGCGGEPSTNSGSANPYLLRNSTSTSQGSPSSLFAGSSKSSGSLAAKKKSSLLISSSPVGYLDEAKLRELMAACQRDNLDTPLIRTLSAIFSSYQSTALSFLKKPS